MRVSRRQKRQLFGPLHNLKKIADHIAEAIEQSFPLGGLSREQRDLLGILAHPDEVETEVGLEPLLAKIKRHQRPADEVGERGSNNGVEQRRPHEIAGNAEGRAEQVKGSGRGERPKNYHEGAQRDDRAEQSDADRERAIDEQIDVLGDALVGVVGGVPEQLHAVMVGAGEPMVEVFPCHPAAPADLQPLIEIELIDGEDDVGPRQAAEEQQLPDEVVPIALLQRVVEAVIPLIEHDIDRHDREFDRDHGGKERAPGPAVLGKEIGTGQPEDNGERRDKA